MLRVSRQIARAANLPAGLVFAACAAGPTLAQPFTPDDIDIGTPGVRYTDPEFLPYSNPQLVAFQGNTNPFVFTDSVVWVSRMDRLTGGFLTGPAVIGHETRIDGSPRPIDASLNGPEWGLDLIGPAAVYNRLDAGGLGQLWIARPPAWTPQQITMSPTGVYSVIGSFNPERASFFFLGAEYRSGMDEVVVGDVGNPVIISLPDTVEGTSGGRYIPGTADVALIREVNGVSQIQRQTVVPIATPQTLTDDAGFKQEAWPFFAPEFNGELLYAAIVNRLELRIYRDADGDGLFTAIDHLSIPESPPPIPTHRFLSSVEPVVGQAGAFGRSYFGIVASPDTAQVGITNSSIWLFRLTLPGEAPFTRRVDRGPLDGPIMGRAGRIEPEMFAGENELFLYYSLGGADGQFRRCRTGIGGPLISVHPASALTCPGGSGSMTVAATGGIGAGETTYQWQAQLGPSLAWVDLTDGPVTTPSGSACGNVSGTATPTLHFDTVTACANPAAQPRFRCLATNGFGSVPSFSATLTICPADFNCDATLDPDDLADYIGAYFTIPPAANSDFNADGTTDPDDLADYIGAFFSGCT